MWCKARMKVGCCYITLHYTLDYITLHYRHFKRHIHLKWPVVHQQLHVIRNTAHRRSTQASYTASRVQPKMKISGAAAQIAATLTISFPRLRHMSFASYWGQQRHAILTCLCFYSFYKLDWWRTLKLLQFSKFCINLWIETPLSFWTDDSKCRVLILICDNAVWNPFKG